MSQTYERMLALHSRLFPGGTMGDVPFGIVRVPDSPDREMIQSNDQGLELHAQELSAIFRATKYMIVEIKGGGRGPEDPPPATSEYENLSQSHAIRLFFRYLFEEKLTAAMQAE